MIVDCAVYQDGQRRDGSVDVRDATQACRQDGVWTWIGLYEPTEQEFETATPAYVLVLALRRTDGHVDDPCEL